MKAWKIPHFNVVGICHVNHGKPWKVFTEIDTYRLK
jgi:hypothetical protein